MLKQNSGGKTPSHQSDFAPALDSEPVFERPAEERWEVEQRPEPFIPFLPNAAGSWADTLSAYDVDSPPGPGFLDPGSHALMNHVAPRLAAESFHAGALAGASLDLASAPPVMASSAPVSTWGGDDDDDGTPKPPKPRR
jgi:hypothetical protein